MSSYVCKISYICSVVYEYCNQIIIFLKITIAEKRANASKFLTLLKEVGSVDSQVALLLLCQCGGFCRIVHSAICTPPVALEGLQLFDEEICQTFSDSM